MAQKVAVERVFQELEKLLCAQHPATGLRLLEGSGLLDLWLPELRPLVGLDQNHYHDLDAWEHTLAVVDGCPAEPPCGGPRCCTIWARPAPGASARTVWPISTVTRNIPAGWPQRVLNRLKASRALVDSVLALVRHHGQRPTPEWSDAACRRLLARLEGDRISLDAWAACAERILVGGRTLCPRPRRASRPTLTPARARADQTSAHHSGSGPERARPDGAPRPHRRSLAGRSSGPSPGASAGGSNPKHAPGPGGLGPNLGGHSAR